MKKLLFATLFVAWGTQVLALDCKNYETGKDVAYYALDSADGSLSYYSIVLDSVEFEGWGESVNTFEDATLHIVTEKVDKSPVFDLTVKEVRENESGKMTYRGDLKVRDPEVEKVLRSIKVQCVD